MIIHTLLCILHLEIIKSQCSDPCICDNYQTTEAPGCVCQAYGNNCDCTGARICSQWGYCHGCDELSACPPIICSQSNYYQVGANCFPCDAHCLTCTGAGACSICSSPFLVSSGMCVCPSGTYISGSTCASCDANCLTCTGSGACSICSSPYVLNGGICVCPSGTYNAGSTCSACDANCLICTGTGACSQCASTYVISNGVCVCSAGTYNAGSSCVTCNSICITCTSGSYCTSCRTNYYYYSGQVNKSFFNVIF